jgi:hypothetical protein
VHGKGTFVAGERIQSTLHLASFTDDMRRRGLVAATLEGEAAPSSPAGGLGAAVLAALDAGLDPEAELRRWTAALRQAALGTDINEVSSRGVRRGPSA